MRHITVLQKEAVDGLKLAPEAIVVDATYGGGGHARSILSSLNASGHLYAFDADEQAFADSPLEHDNATAIVANFRTLNESLAERGVQKVDAILADLGWRTDQFESGGKGFSFSSSEPLLMTFGNPEGHIFTAHDVVNDWSEENIADVIYAYGEEPFSRVIAAAIVAARAEGEIKTASQLAELIYECLPGRAKRGRLHPATKTFQAIRIAVNDELGALKDFLSNGFSVLNEGGVMAVISFHSLEDRIVKHTFRAFAEENEAEVLTKRPITPSDGELKANPRSRSAKLRIIKKTHD